MGVVWISFNIGIVVLSISEECYAYWDSEASNLALIIARYLTYVVLVYYSLSRCRQLCLPQLGNYRRPQSETQTPARRESHSSNAS